jgi:hypothetical protein
MLFTDYGGVGHSHFYRQYFRPNAYIFGYSGTLIRQQELQGYLYASTRLGSLGYWSQRADFYGHPSSFRQFELFLSGLRSSQGRLGLDFRCIRLYLPDIARFLRSFQCAVENIQTKQPSERGGYSPESDNSSENVKSDGKPELALFRACLIGGPLFIGGLYLIVYGIRPMSLATVLIGWVGAVPGGFLFLLLWLPV